MRKLGPLSLLLVCTAAFLVQAVSLPAAAQTITTQQLASVTIAAGEIDGFHLVKETASPCASGTAPSDCELLFTREFAADSAPEDGVASGYIAISLGFAPSDATIKETVRNLASETAGFRRDHALPPLGVGEVDYAYMLNLPDSTGSGDGPSGRAVSAYGDTFLRRHVLVVIVYRDWSDSADPGLLAKLTHLQDQKLVDAAFLPDALLAP